MILPFRGEQQRVFDELSARCAEGLNPLVVAPCGFGKGVVISHIVDSALTLARLNRYNVSIIFAVHGISLVVDMSGRLTKANIPHGVLMGGAKRQRWHSVQVASLDTLARMHHPPPCDIFIIDEAHLALAPIWKKTILRFPNARIIGLTATPIRLDGKSLGRESGGFFDCMVMGPTAQGLISDGWLVRSRVLEPPPVEGAREVKTKGGNDNLGAQAAVFDKTQLIGDEIDHYKKHASGRKGVTFCADQKHAAHVAQAFSEAGVPWVYVGADTPIGDENSPQPGTRAAIWRDLDSPNGNLMGIASVAVPQIGWDHPIVSYLGIMRKFGSLGGWHQTLGRGSRIYPGKSDFLVIDHAGNTELHAPYGYFESEIPWSIDGEAVKVCPECNGTGKRKPPLDHLKCPACSRAASVLTCKSSFLNCPCGAPVVESDNPADLEGRHDRSGTHWPCYGTFNSGPDECPHCRCPVPKKSRKVETVGGELVERARPEIFPLAGPIPESLSARVAGEFALVAHGASDKDRRTFEFLLKKAKREGKKPGWACAVFAAKTGVPVPTEWMRG